MQLLRAGVKLAGLIPPQALNRANVAIHEKGIPFDLSQIKPENLEELIDQLSDLSVDVDQNDHAAKVKVKVFCE
jgi:antitoxin component of RelBE/YafQ-DinJ toxin-antitoxin module